MAIQTRQFADGTSITQSFPWGVYVRARVLCPDGKVRATARIAQTSDTFFSVPCAVKAHGKTVAGYLTVATRSGLSTATDADPARAVFVPYTYRRNHAVFA